MIALTVAMTSCHKSPTTPSTTDDTTTTTTTTTTETQAVPTVTAISPTIGSADGETTVTITGTDFTNVSAVLFGTTSAKTYTVDSDTSITATAPAGTAGTASAVAVKTPGGTSVTGDGQLYTFDRNLLTDLSFPSASVAPGTTIRGSATLRYAAPTGGILLKLFWATTPARATAIQYPLSAFVPSGSTTGSFQVTTFYTSSQESLEVATAYGGETKVATLTVRP
jgi:hypothetical protein